MSICHKNGSNKNVKEVANILLPATKVMIHKALEYFGVLASQEKVFVSP